MNKKTFDDTINYIKSLEDTASRYEKDLKNQVSYIGPVCENLLKNLSRRKMSFSKYLTNLRDFNYSEELSTPSNLFPGVRTPLNNENIDEVRKKTEEMKSQAEEIDISTKNIDIQSRELLQHLKACISALSEYILQENQIYDVEVQLTQDLDSIYDIGRLKSATN